MRRSDVCLRLSVVAVLMLVHTCGGLDIDVSGCGQSKGCFQSPDGCDAASCNFLLTWKDSGSDSVLFEMSAPVESRPPYVAFGLSQDDNMVTRHRFMHTRLTYRSRLSVGFSVMLIFAISVHLVKRA